MQLKSTRIDHLSYRKVHDRVWRIVDTTDGRNAEVGPCYKSEKLLLEDFDDYYARSWAPVQKKVVFIVFGDEAAKAWGWGEIDEQVKEGLQKFEFDTDGEVNAFIRGIEVTLGNDGAVRVEPEDAQRIQEFDLDADTDSEDESEDPAEGEQEGQQPTLPPYPTSVEDHAARFPDQVFVQTLGRDAYDVKWDINLNLTDRWGDINYADADKKPLHDLMAEEGLLDRLHLQMFDEITFVVRKDGAWGILFELELCCQESEDGAVGADGPWGMREELEQSIMQVIADLAPKFPKVHFASAHPYQGVHERNCLWAFVPDGALSRADLDELGDAVLTFGYGSKRVQEGC